MRCTDTNVSYRSTHTRCAPATYFSPHPLNYLPSALISLSSHSPLTLLSSYALVLPSTPLFFHLHLLPTMLYAPTLPSHKQPRAPLHLCCISLACHIHPVASRDGLIFENAAITQLCRRTGLNPITGHPLSPHQLISLRFSVHPRTHHYCCPVLRTVFEPHVKVVAIASTGNVYSYDAVHQHNLQSRAMYDLIDNTPFTSMDIIVLYDPTIHVLSPQISNPSNPSAPSLSQSPIHSRPSLYNPNPHSTNSIGLKSQSPPTHSLPSQSIRDVAPPSYTPPPSSLPSQNFHPPEPHPTTTLINRSNPPVTSLPPSAIRPPIHSSNSPYPEPLAQRRASLRVTSSYAEPPRSQHLATTKSSNIQTLICKTYDHPSYTFPSQNQTSSIPSQLHRTSRDLSTPFPQMNSSVFVQNGVKRRVQQPTHGRALTKKPRRNARLPSSNATPHHCIHPHVSMEKFYRKKREEEERKAVYKKIRKGKKGKGYVRVVTNIGHLNIELHCDRVPTTCDNFLTLAQRKYYDGLAWHRVVPGFVAQTGDPTGTDEGGESAWGGYVKDEIRTNLVHDVPGIVAMANSGRDTNTSRWYVSFDAAPHLDGTNTVFGKVVGGLYVLQKMESEAERGNPLTVERIEVLVNPICQIREQMDLEKAQASTQNNTNDAACAINSQSSTIPNGCSPPERTCITKLTPLHPSLSVEKRASFGPSRIHEPIPSRNLPSVRSLINAASLGPPPNRFPSSSDPR